MLGLILLVAGLVYAFKIPSIQKTSPDSFTSPDPETFNTWKAKELWSIYVFLIATWGQMAVFFVAGLMVNLLVPTNAARVPILGVLVALELIIFLGGLIWAGVLGSQAARLKKQMMKPGMPASYYPRAGAPLLQDEATPPAEPPVE